MTELATELSRIMFMDKIQAYDERNRSVIKAVWLALSAGLSAGFRIDPAEPDWPVAFVELPSGQVSWHLQQHFNAWDGHDIDEKNRRVMAFVENSA